MSRMTQEELRKALGAQLRGRGLSEEAVLAKLVAFDEAWVDAHPKPWGPPYEFHTGTLSVQYLCLPGCYSGAETAVLEFFGLLDAKKVGPEPSEA